MISSRPLKQEVTEQLHWMFDKFAFRLVEDDFDPKSFGNSFVTLETSGIRIRIVRDRGQVHAEVAARSDSEMWWNVEHVCELIINQNVRISHDLLSIDAVLQNHMLDLVELLGPKYPETKHELERRAEERKLAFIKRLSQ